MSDPGDLDARVARDRSALRGRRRAASAALVRLPRRAAADRVLEGHAEPPARARRLRRATATAGASSVSTRESIIRGARPRPRALYSRPWRLDDRERPPPPSRRRDWTIETPRALYNIEGWGAGFFDINEKGHVVVRPDKEQPDRAARPVRARERSRGAGRRAAGAAALLRHPPLAHRGAERRGSSSAIEEFDYTGGYTTVYPIKVNQQRHVVEEIVEFGKAHGVGLECGSKPELQAVLGLAENTDHLIVCNGYKDEEFMRLALMGQKLGHQVFIVIEQLSEIDVLLQVADELGVTPTAGVRIKLASRRLRALEGERRREVEVRAQRRAAHAGDRQAARRRPARHRQADPLPSRLADHRHPLHQARACRS